MKTKSRPLILAALLCAAALSGTAWASGDVHGGHSHGAAAPQAEGAGAVTEGEVKKIDKEAQKITLRHGEIKNIGMPPMTMVFKVKDPAMLDTLQAGDKVRFVVERAEGAMVVTQIEAKK